MSDTVAETYYYNFIKLLFEVIICLSTQGNKNGCQIGMVKKIIDSKNSHFWASDLSSLTGKCIVNELFFD